MKIVSQNGIIFLLLTVSEDKATQRCDPSAGTEVSGKGDASSITLFYTQVHQSITLSGNPNALNLEVRGRAPAQVSGSVG